MFELSIDPELKARVPVIAVGWIAVTVTSGIAGSGMSSGQDDELWREIATAARRFSGLTMDQARQAPPIRALRDAYRTLGNDPTRYRGSNEALVRRIVQGKNLYPVGTLVDLGNLVSLETLHSTGTFDRERFEEPVVLRIGRAGESYLGIGRGEINLAGLPVFADRVGPFGCTTSDSQRTCVRGETKHVVMVIVSFLGRQGPDDAVARAAGLWVRYAGATSLDHGIVA